MRFFASSYQLHELTPRTLWLMLLLLVGLPGVAISGILMHHRGPGWTPESVATHYRGRQIDTGTLDEAALAQALSGAPGTIDLPAKTFDALLDVAHMHLVWMPLLVFLVAHLFAMTSGGRGTWGGLLGYGTLLAALTDILTPFLVRYHHAGWAYAKLGAFVVLEAGLLVMIAGILWTGGRALYRPTT